MEDTGSDVGGFLSSLTVYLNKSPVKIVAKHIVVNFVNGGYTGIP
jgi:hypothetical protein